ncbi:MAG: DNA-directed RNA polymerase subunit beta, partial [Puniceicoccales bacterium]|nr:DNA-directed RNA polymerase subunit beta [Puniceicoccales bacterium]
MESFDGGDNISNHVLVEDIIDTKDGIVLAREQEQLSKTIIDTFRNAGIKHIPVVDASLDDGMIVRSLKKDTTKNTDEALRETYRKLRPGEPATTTNAKAMMLRLFGDRKRYDLGRVGRKKLNQKLKMRKNLEDRLLDASDIVAATKRLCRLRKGEHSVDDIDHLGNRRIRNVGELIMNQCRIGLSRMERLVRERIALFDNSVDAIVPQKLVNPKIFMSVIRDFFARSQLSQFMDQINPLAELAHKRRLSALGPGGLS